MNYDEWLLSQFEVKVITEGKQKGRVCFHTPCYDYTLSREDWRKIRNKLIELE